jgi:tetratricopeptide (TPR) repeat protein
MHLKKYKDEETLSFINKFISSFENYFFSFEDRIPDSLFDLVLESKQYNAVFQIISSNMNVRNMLPEKIEKFLDSVKMAAEELNDENFYASYYFFHDREKYESVIERLEMTDRNFEVFTKSSFQYHRAADYMFREGKIERAARVCRSHKDFNMAASIYEKAGDFKAAGKDYRDAKNYSDALRCFQKINDERSIARVYERMKEYRSAIDIWKRLDRPREIMRIEKKMKKEEAKREQLNLFQ